MLVHPATVARWHREGFRWLRHRARRRPGRPRIDPQLRNLIERIALENGLWGAPRIHGELLKLGFIVSERTVSRYLPDRRTRRSQTWWTFFANHVGNLAFTSTTTSSFATSHDDVDASVWPCRPVPPSCGPYVSTPWAVVDWPTSHQPASLGRCFAQHPLHRRTRRRFTSGTEAPRSRAIKTEPSGISVGEDVAKDHSLLLGAHPPLACRGATQVSRRQHVSANEYAGEPAAHTKSGPRRRPHESPWIPMTHGDSGRTSKLMLAALHARPPSPKELRSDSSAAHTGIPASTSASVGSFGV
jgi:hypothetical protein